MLTELGSGVLPWAPEDSGDQRSTEAASRHMLPHHPVLGGFPGSSPGAFMAPLWLIHLSQN